MDNVTQAEAFAQAPLTHGERAQFWREARFDGLECLSATFREHTYAPHTHETYVFGTIEAGCECYRIRGEMRYASPGDICMVNPDEVHDGEPHGPGYAYRMSYPSVPLIRKIASDLLGRPATSVPFFRVPMAPDPELAARFSRLHRLLEAGGGKLEEDEAMHGVFAAALARYADLEPAPAPLKHRRGIAEIRDYLHANFAQDIDLATLSRVSGLTRSHLVRAFKRETGLTPHAYLTDIRVRAARRLLSTGALPADVAADCGFYDQSHLNRHFKARSGVTPGTFRARGKIAA
ncbi:helix-turn-helix domain-containing protein [Stappia sp. GBMRC 2046]|uniref:Helix-turn-helix domain-containing protein n=1 Tax=Stappia sediminis TaxID=2692190 RepID=A0A7X3LR29_9HYPH|nr:AraC family transcriptional regulator [Stappia sediminis]MXN63537.1 helix-turn-helix domain-containing protein [Stappia sediminis]